MKSTVSSKGQITIPQEIRDQLGLESGTRVEFEIVAGGALMRKAGLHGRTGSHPVDKVFGVLSLTKSVDQLIAEVRGPRPDKK